MTYGYFDIKRNGPSKKFTSFYQFGASEIRSKSSARLECSVMIRTVEVVILTAYYSRLWFSIYSQKGKFGPMSDRGECFMISAGIRAQSSHEC